MVKIKDKEKNHKRSKRKATYYIKGRPCKAIGRFFNRSFTGQKEVNDISQVLKGKNWQSRCFLPYWVIISELKDGLRVFQISKS